MSVFFSPFHYAVVLYTVVVLLPVSLIPYEYSVARWRSSLGNRHALHTKYRTCFLFFIDSDASLDQSAPFTDTHTSIVLAFLFLFGFFIFLSFVSYSLPFVLLVFMLIFSFVFPQFVVLLFSLFLLLLFSLLRFCFCFVQNRRSSRSSQNTTFLQRIKNNKDFQRRLLCVPLSCFSIQHQTDRRIYEGISSDWIYVTIFRIFPNRTFINI